jgi:hypothetical protein
MSGRLRMLIVILVGALALTACGSDATWLGDAVPLPPDSVPLPRPAPKLAAAATRSPAPTLPAWHHLPEPVSAQQFDQDKAKCTKVANATPGVGSPEIKFYLAFTDCMHSEGYEASL